MAYLCHPLTWHIVICAIYAEFHEQHRHLKSCQEPPMLIFPNTRFSLWKDTFVLCICFHLTLANSDKTQKQKNPGENKKQEENKMRNGGPHSAAFCLQHRRLKSCQEPLMCHLRWRKFLGTPSINGVRTKNLPTHTGEHSHFNRLPLPMWRVHLKGCAHHLTHSPQPTDPAVGCLPKMMPSSPQPRCLMMRPLGLSHRTNC